MASGKAIDASGLGPGTVLDGKYEILSLLGAGGMGEVFKARHVHLDVFRCIKVMKRGLLTDDASRARFLREAQLATQVHHPNIAAVHDFFLGDRGSYMVSEFIDGTTVRQWSSTFGAFPLALAADVAVQTLAGLDHIHKRGLLHRDISSDNIMLSFDADGTVVAKIIDLGIAKDVRSTNVHATQAGMLLGNPKYMSPEQLGGLADGEQLDGRADLYCLGVVLYEMLLGVPPFVSETPQGYIAQHLLTPPMPFAQAKPGTTWEDGLEGVILRALEKERQRRFADAREFSRALRPYLRADPGTLTTEDVVRLRRERDARQLAEKAYAEAIAADSYVAFRDFLARFPNAPQSAAARDALAERLAFETAAAAQSEDAWEDYLETYGDDSHAAAARALRDALVRREEEAFEGAANAKSIAAWEAFLDRFPDGRLAARAERQRREAIAFDAALDAVARGEADEAESMLSTIADADRRAEVEVALDGLRERQAWEAASTDGGAEALRAYVEARPMGRWTAEALRRIDRLDEERSAAERRDWDEAWESGTVAAWDRYLERHGETSPRLAIARDCRQEALDFDVAVAQSAPKMWRAFLRAWPEGRHRLDAEIRLRRSTS